MTEIQVRTGRKAYIKLIKQQQSLISQLKNPDEIDEILSNIAWNSFSDIAANSKKTNKIYVLISCMDVKNDKGEIVDKVYTYMDLENYSTRTIWSLEFGAFYREKDKNGKPANIILDPTYCNGIVAFLDERKRFFYELARNPKEDIIKRYRTGAYLEELKKQKRNL